MDSVRSFFANANKENNLGNQQNGASGRWATWNRNMQSPACPGSVNASMRDVNRGDVKPKDKDNYFYIMWRA
ncbi:uncharacterized protein LOC6559835 [Drosophila grimshawi]|uniref:GH20519 n=1 Tax=Drosophila grimshawi TaxID=7222 RepID=B4J8X7_DROGR|nr:uncharacterized protein LOC6559835 [Drosophila grimshawi]EDW01326.1 GH20519 [Drosophila grimshawi]